MERVIVCSQGSCNYNEDGLCVNNEIFIGVNGTCDSYDDDDDDC